jgi:hypothetical protein
MTDPITLTGGPLGGEEAEGEGWAVGDVADIDGHAYRRDGDYAVYVGPAE